MSRFVADAIRKELELKKNELKQAYISSNTDPSQNQALTDWNSTILDGSNDW